MYMYFKKYIKQKKINFFFFIIAIDLWKSTIHNGRDANSLVAGLTSILQAFVHLLLRHYSVCTIVAVARLIFFFFIIFPYLQNKIFILNIDKNETKIKFTPNYIFFFYDFREFFFN